MNKSVKSSLIFVEPLKLLRLEGLALLVLTLFLFHYFHGSWWLFLSLFLAPDIGLIGYLSGPKIGAFSYNILHTEIWPVLLVGTSLIFDLPLALNIALIWLCHINLDRMLGFGLKYSTAFKETHLGVISFGKKLDITNVNKL
jgi:hypothetical protein